MDSKKTRFCQVALVALSLVSLSTTSPAAAQVAGANQTIYHDEQEMLNTDQAMINQYTSAENEAESKLAAEQAKTNAYRLYAEQRIQELQKQKKGVSPSLAGAKSGEMTVLTSWLQQDSAYRAKQQAYIDQLEQCISNLRTSQTNTLANLNTDINALRQGVQDDKDQQKFQNQMQMNQFNELKSEMGACSWGDTPRDGTYNSVGGYGFNGGYGYSAMGGRRWLGGGRGY
ncbi:MAG: hypothetical protein Q8T09_12410 [Candidatus Melainabacteria bacterium]|jgi:hypothetical protein|nr:hypothetical protein [Candidatus Melainabacteria bacterium]